MIFWTRAFGLGTCNFRVYERSQVWILQKINSKPHRYGSCGFSRAVCIRKKSSMRYDHCDRNCDAAHPMSRDMHALHSLSFALYIVSYGLRLRVGVFASMLAYISRMDSNCYRRLSDGTCRWFQMKATNPTER